MSEHIIINSALQASPTKESGTYSGLTDADFIVSGEIMVTITLHEYRSLLIGRAEAEASSARSDKYRAERERDELKKQVVDLQNQLNELRSMIAGAVQKPETAEDA